MASFCNDQVNEPLEGFVLFYVCLLDTVKSIAVIAPFFSFFDAAC